MHRHSLFSLHPSPAHHFVSRFCLCHDFASQTFLTYLLFFTNPFCFSMGDKQHHGVMNLLGCTVSLVAKSPVNMRAHTHARNHTYSCGHTHSTRLTTVSRNEAVVHRFTCFQTCISLAICFHMLAHLLPSFPASCVAGPVHF